MGITVTGGTRKDRWTNEPPPLAVVLIDPTTTAGVQPSGFTGRTLSFSDEFNGSKLDLLKWDTNYPDWPTFNSQSPGGRFTNTNNANVYDSAHVSVNGASNLVLMAEKVSTVTGLAYTSGMIQSLKSYTPTIGSFTETSVKLVGGLADKIWPAVWMSNSQYNTWPPEIDFFENYGGGTIVYTNMFGGTSGNIINTHTVASALSNYHTFGVWWKTDGTCLFYFDGTLVQSSTTSPVFGSQYLIANLGTDASKPADFTGQYLMYVDYIRVWAT